MSEGRGVLIWVIICSLLGIAFGVFFNPAGIKIIAEIWFGIGTIAGFAFLFGSDLGDGEMILGSGWLCFGIALGLTVAAYNYQSWLAPLLR